MRKQRSSLMVLGLLLLVVACMNPLENVQLGFKDPIEKGVVEIRFRSLKGALPTGVDLTVAGPDAEQVVTTLNTTSYKINEEGVLVLAAAPEADYSRADPLRFVVAAKAPDYLTILQPVELADTGRYSLAPAWIKLNDPPAHLSAVMVTDRKLPLTSDLKTATPSLNQKKENVAIQIEQGSEFKDAGGQTLTGTLMAALVHIENRGNNPANYLPNGSVMPTVTGLDGKNLGSLQLSQIAGLFSLELYDDQFRVARQISKPVLCTMTLNPETINPPLGRPIQVGDEIPFFRYNRFSARWQQEKPVAVSRNASTGQLECRVSVTQSAVWVAGWTQAACEEGPVFTVSSKLNQVDIQYLCKVINADTRQETTSFYSPLNNGTRLTLSHLLQNQRVQLQVYNYNNAYSSGNPGQPLLETGPLPTCNQTPQPLDLQKLPIPPAITVRFDFACPPPTRLDESKLPTKVRLQYTESGQKNWRELVTLNRKDLQALSYKLKLHQPYDIRVSTDGGASWPLERHRFTPNNNTLVFDLASPEFCVL
ncbi:hypothetical protein ACFPMF_10465 [Larkinella bovis]|uniref:Carboxypeptidase regulatory-like domain-containing protein n=1 Tax=Larkinella bovis TaxID=683041 RepID=A0ABW0IEF4_9BACT